MGLTINEEEKMVHFFKDKEDTIVDAILNFSPFRQCFSSPNYVESMSLSKWNSMSNEERRAYRDKYDYDHQETSNC